jgi:hypothetical protein
MSSQREWKNEKISLRLTGVLKTLLGLRIVRGLSVWVSLTEVLAESEGMTLISVSLAFIRDAISKQKKWICKN